jgi:IS605 OrfB family transposase
MKIQIYPTDTQKTILNEIYSVHRYVYNKTLNRVKIHGDYPNFQNLRNKLVTRNTKLNSLTSKIGNQDIKQISNKIKLDPENEALKTEKKAKQQEVRTSLKSVVSQRNSEIRDFELLVSKEIRANAVKNVCDAYKTGFTNLKKGNIKSFDMKFKKKTESRKCVELAKSEVKIENGKIVICKRTIKENEDPEIKNYEFCMSTKNVKKTKDLVISHSCDLVLENGKYILYILIDTTQEQRCETKPPKIIAGGDLGVRHFLTTYNNKSEIYEYDHNREYLKRLNDNIRRMKNFRKKKMPSETRKIKKSSSGSIKKRTPHRTSYRKKQIRKIEKKKKDYADNLHWYVINHLVKTNDVICMGDIKSQGIMKKNKNRYLNQEFSDLSFFKFKQRLAYKASVANKKMILVSEMYTSQGCSFCGCINKHIKSSTILNCNECKNHLSRDINSSKNHLMKGLLL